MTDVYAMILAGGAGTRLSILTEHRAKPGVPFGGKFRIIDFVLSNCTNSNLSDVGLLTQYRPRSLIEHVGTGRAWDLDRTVGGLHVLQPSLDAGSGGWYQGTADAVSRNLFQILRRSVEDVLILSGDHVYAMDYRPFIRFHRERRFPATMAVIPVPPGMSNQFGMVRRSESGIVEEFQEKPKNTDLTLASMGVYIFRRDILVRLLQEDQENPQSSHDFGRDIFPRVIQLSDVGAHRYDGYWQDIGTLQAFYDENMKSLELEHRRQLNRPDWPIRTPSVDAPPVRIQGAGRICHSTAANGAVIRGEVVNSVLSPGVIVEPGAVVRDSILMGQTHIGPGARVTGAILDKRVRVGEGSILGADVPHAAPPNSRIPDLLRTGLTVLGKDVHIAAGAKVGSNVCIGGQHTLGEGEVVEDGAYIDDQIPQAATT